MVFPRSRKDSLEPKTVFELARELNKLNNHSETINSEVRDILGKGSRAYWAIETGGAVSEGQLDQYIDAMRYNAARKLWTRATQMIEKKIAETEKTTADYNPNRKRLFRHALEKLQADLMMGWDDAPDGCVQKTFSGAKAKWALNLMTTIYTIISMETGNSHYENLLTQMSAEELPMPAEATTPKIQVTIPKEILNAVCAYEMGLGL